MVVCTQAVIAVPVHGQQVVAMDQGQGTIHQVLAIIQVATGHGEVTQAGVAATALSARVPIMTHHARMTILTEVLARHVLPVASQVLLQVDSPEAASAVAMQPAAVAALVAVTLVAEAEASVEDADVLLSLCRCAKKTDYQVI